MSGLGRSQTILMRNTYHALFNVSK